MNHKADIRIYPSEVISFSRIAIGMLCSTYNSAQSIPSDRDLSGWKEPDVFTKISKDEAYNLRTDEIVSFGELDRMILVFLNKLNLPIV